MDEKNESEDVMGRLIHYDDEGFLYFRVNHKNRSKARAISHFLTTMNINRKVMVQNYLYYHQLDYSVGYVCAALTEHDNFGRAKVIRDIDYNTVEVFFVDTGRKSIVTRNRLQPLPDWIRQIKPIIDTCRIPNLKIIDLPKFNNTLEPLIGHEIALSFGDCVLLNRVLSSDLSVKCLVRHVLFNVGEVDVRTHLLNENVVIEYEDYVYTFVIKDLTDNMDNPIEEAIDTLALDQNTRPLDDTMDSESATSSSSEFNLTRSKHVYVSCFHSSKDFYVQEVSTSMKNKLDAMQKQIDNLADKYVNNDDENIFNTNNIYLAQYSEDHQWYRIQICRYDDFKGFYVHYIDWGNFEYKETLAEFVLLTRDMGDDAIFLMNEEGMAKKCKLTKTLRNLFADEPNLRNFFIRHFQLPVRRIKLEFKIRQSVWEVSGIFWHNIDLNEMINMFGEAYQTGLAEGNDDDNIDLGNGEYADGYSSHSDNFAGNQKVIDFLINSGNNGKSNKNRTGDYLEHPSDPFRPRSPPALDDNEIDDTESTALSSNDDDFLATQIHHNRMVEFREYTITHFADLNEIWVDFDDGQTKEMRTHLISIMAKHRSTRDDVIQSGYMYVVKYNDEFYRCQVLDIETDSNEISVHLLDKGPVISVEFDSIYPISVSLAALPITIKKFKLPNQLLLESTNSIKKYVVADLRMLENTKCRLVRESSESNVLIDLISTDTINLNETLALQNTKITWYLPNNWTRSLVQALMLAQVFKSSQSVIDGSDMSIDSIDAPSTSKFRGNVRRRGVRQGYGRMTRVPQKTSSVPVSPLR